MVLTCGTTLAFAQGALTNGANHTGAIAAPAESDAWTISAAPGDTIALSLSEVGPNTDFTPWLRLLDPNGSQVGTSSSSLVAQVTVTAGMAGTYTAVVASGDVGNDATGSYVLTVAKAPGAFVVPAGDQGGALQNGVSHAGAIPRGDLDLWTFDAAQGDAIVVSIGETGSVETFNPWIRVIGPTGAIVAANSGSVVAQLMATAPATGVYSVLVASGDVGNDGDGTYALTLGRVPAAFDVPVGDHGGALGNGAREPGEITVGDIDLWAFQATAGDAIALSIGETAAANTFNPWLRLFGPTGQLVGADSGSLVGQLNVTATATGTYTVVVASADVGNEGVGTYALALAKVPGAFAVPAGDDGGPAANGVAMPGRIAIGDLDLWTFFAVQGAAISVRMTEVPSGGEEPTFNPWIRLRDPSGALVAADTGSVFAQHTGTAPVTGLYTVIAATADVGNDGTGNYELVVTGTAPTPTTVNDSYAVAASSPRVVAAPGVLANDSAHGAGVLDAVLVTGPVHGTLGLGADGGFVYTPNAGYLGPDAFTYRAVSAAGPGNVATVALSVVDTTTAQPPTELYAHRIAGNLMTLRWTPPAAGAVPTGYVLEGGVTPGSVLASIPTGSTTPILSVGVPTGAFYVRIRTVSGGLVSPPSNEIRVFVNVPAAPSAPSGLLGTVNGGALALAWRNTFAGGAPTSVILDVSGSINASLALGAVETFSVNGVPPGTYTFRVRAANGAGASPQSNAVTLSFPGPCTAAPQTPQGFLAYRQGNQINVLWAPAASGAAPTAYALSVTGAFTGSFVTPATAIGGGVGPGTYQLRVAAVNPCGASASTAAQSVVVP